MSSFLVVSVHKEFRRGGGSWGPQISLCRISLRALFALDVEAKNILKRCLGYGAIGSPYGPYVPLRGSWALSII